MAVIATIAAAVGAIAACVAVYLVNQAIRDNSAERRTVECDRDRHRIERVGELVEDVYMAAHRDQLSTPPGDSWKEPCDRLRHAMVGLKNRLPQCADILMAEDAAMAEDDARRARPHVEAELNRLAQAVSGQMAEPGP